jgi:hypothetical protein
MAGRREPWRPDRARVLGQELVGRGGEGGVERGEDAEFGCDGEVFPRRRQERLGVDQAAPPARHLRQCSCDIRGGGRPDARHCAAISA